MIKIFNYLKYIGIFFTIELFVTFIISLFNLMGIQSGITSLILFVFNIVIFFVLNFKNAQQKEKNGYIEGLILGLLFIIMMILIKSFLLNTNYNIATLIYYSMLLICAILGGILGINKKKANSK